MTNDDERPGWFRDLSTGDGSAQGLDPALRSAMLIATENAAREQVAAERAKAEQLREDSVRRQEQERRDMQIRDEQERHDKQIRDEQQRNAEESARRQSLQREGNPNSLWAIGLAFAAAFINPFGVTSVAAIVNGVRGRTRGTLLREAGIQSTGFALSTVAIVMACFNFLTGFGLTILLIASYVMAGS